MSAKHANDRQPNPAGGRGSGGGVDELTTSVRTLTGVQSILHEHRHCHRTNTARHRTDSAAYFRYVFKINIPNNCIAIFLGGVGNSIDSNIDDYRSGLYHVGSNKFRLTNRRNDDVGLTNNRRQILSLRMSNGNRAIACLGNK